MGFEPGKTAALAAPVSKTVLRSNPLTIRLFWGF
jgi:hypothetical protein